MTLVYLNTHQTALQYDHLPGATIQGLYIGHSTLTHQHSLRETTNQLTSHNCCIH